MSKAVLVMDMPVDCSECIMQEKNISNRPMCKVYRRFLNPYPAKPDWCPLKSLPEKRKSDTRDNDIVFGIVEGWNACIDAIGGGEHGGQ